MNITPFISEDEFNQWKSEGGKPDCIFPIMDYSMCKYIWENSPLIASVVDGLEETLANAKS